MQANDTWTEDYKADLIKKAYEAMKSPFSTIPHKLAVLLFIKKIQNRPIHISDAFISNIRSFMLTLYDNQLAATNAQALTI